MTHPFQNDSFAVLWRVFGEMFPNCQAPVVQWADDFDFEERKGEFVIPDDADSDFYINVHVQCPVVHAIEVLAHELAHAGCHHLGFEHPMTPEDHKTGESGRHWREIFDDIWRRYHEIVDGEDASES